jgi:alpha-beta hydrolase superfamily lysophospholipase
MTGFARTAPVDQVEERPADAARPLYIGPPDQRLFAWYHPARQLPARDCAVVICHPIGYEYVCAYRAIRHLADALAAGGLPTMRFDYHGTGDSSGSDHTHERLAAWLRSINTAIDAVRAQSGATRVALVGIRLGATLATQAAAQRAAGDVDSLVLWGALSSGKAWVRELRAFRLLASAFDDEMPPEALRYHREDDEESAGFAFTRDTLDELRGLDLAELPRAPVRRALVLGRDDLAGDEVIAEQLTALGVDAEYRRPAGYAAMMRDPHDSIVPAELFASIVDWLRAGHPARIAGDPSPPVPPGHFDRVDREGDLPPVATDRPRHAIREEPLFYGPNHRMVGILTEPMEAADRLSTPAILLLNAGSVHRIGSNRMYVTFAREWAALGYTVYRIDIGGIGDSLPSDGQVENKTYSETAVPDVLAAMRRLSEARGARRFILGGLCSGAYSSFHTGLASQEVTGAIFINPQTFRWHEGDSLAVSHSRTYHELAHYRRVARRWQNWRKALLGQINFLAIARTFSKRWRTVLRARVRTLLHVTHLRRDEDHFGDDLRSLCDRGVDLLLVFSAGDPGVDYLDLHAAADVRRLRSKPNFTMTVIDGPDHTFTPRWSQRRLFEVLTRHLLQRFGA